MTANRLGSALVIAALGVGLAACGGSDSSGADKLAKTELISKANAICDTAQTATKSVTAPATFDDPTVAAAYFDEVVPISKTESKDLQALTPADDVKSDYETFTAAQQKATDLLETIQGKAHAKDKSGVDDLAKLQPTGQKVVAAATTLGAETCAQ